MIDNDHDLSENRIDDDIDYEKQMFDELGVNPYELVVALAKSARAINDKAQKYLGPEFEVRSVNMALKRLSKGNVKFSYENEKMKSNNNTTRE
ncbi:MAG: DNA-directed RNA polymerase subunit omega [Candidatus Latescibacteria bacterium]|nr:DNA-directed RNA polymerase subunit omega [Candidatus Latescibacterota bacterium]